MKLKCDFCKKIFLRERKTYNQKNHFCSLKCKGLFQTQNQTVIFKCDICGKKVIHSISLFNRSKSGKHFCSRSCGAIFNNTGRHNNYKDGNSIYRKRALKYYGTKCTICDYNIIKVLEVHHRDGNRKNNHIKNLDVLFPRHIILNMKEE
jgi:endogenous inhibitor of DNA gyrase (YacG/DUF329 family)